MSTTRRSSCLGVSEGWRWTALRRIVPLLSVLAVPGCDSEEAAGPSSGVHLAFSVEPTSVGVGLPFAPTVVVAIQDAEGDPIWTWTKPVSLTLSSDAGEASVIGATTATPVGGAALFEDLAVTVPGSGYQLVAASGKLHDAVSQPFTVYDDFRAALVTVGRSHSCALDEEGAAFCWGGNEFGQAGNGTDTPAPVPTQVGTQARFVSITAGSSHTCGVTAGGEGFCWGSDSEGQLGGQTTDDCSPVSSSIHRCSTSPLLVSGSLQWQEISAGSYHTCGLTVTGEAYCWGGNWYGQLGDGTTEDRAMPTAVSGGHRFVQISGGYFHSCGLTTDGQPLCWGANHYGELGDSTDVQRNEPTPVHVPLRFETIDAGGSVCHGQTCAVTSAGTTWCWGRNYQRYLNGSDDRLAYAPLPLVDDPGFERVIVGGTIVCGLRTDGALYCWGDSYSGQLGNGNTESASHPIPIAPDLRFSSVSSGWYHTCGTTVGGPTYCWGRNTEGQLGNQSNLLGWTVPVPVWGN
jgi:alpha-tubulin suppressor-like RCC1 family protein